MPGRERRRGRRKREGGREEEEWEPFKLKVVKSELSVYRMAKAWPGQPRFPTE